MTQPATACATTFNWAGRLIAALSIALLGFDGLTAQEARPLFNGKNLQGWVLVNTPPQTWSVSEGMLVCTGKPIGELRTDTMYQNFELELEWRHMVPAGNAGVFLWADDITARGVPFHRGIEVQVLENAYGNTESHTTHGDIFPIHGATMTPVNGRRGSRAFPTEERSKPSPEWNHYRIVCQDGDVSLAVNGKVVTEGRKASPRKGYICLESEGGVVHYRNIRINVLPDTPVDATDVAISDRGYRSIYTGLDLSGWKVDDAARDAWQAKDWELVFDGTVQPDKARLESIQIDRMLGAIVDFRFTKDSQQLTIEVPGLKEPVTVRASDDPHYAEALEKRGSWNRIQFQFDGPTANCLINQQSFELAGEPVSGTIAIIPSGPVTLANLYIR